MDWTRFSFDYRLELAGVFSDLIAIEAYKEAALSLVLPLDWRDGLDRLNRVRAIRGTTALEGNPLSEAEVARQIDALEGPGAQDRSGISREQLQIRNAGIAQAWVRQRFYPGSAPITISDILRMHSMITGHSDVVNNIPGKFRTFEVTVGSAELGGVHKGAPQADVPRLMEEYVRFVNSNKLMAEHPVVRALLSHFYLVTIHPFGDGNGRVSRLVEAGILFQGGYNVLGFYGLSNYFYRNEQEYKTLLQRSRHQQPFEVMPFIIFGLKGFGSELKGINNFIKTKLNRVIYRAMLARALNTRTGPRRRLLNQREYSLLNFLITETEPEDPFSDSPSRKIRLSELESLPYIKAAYGGVTKRTFYRELIRLGDLGFIGFTTEGLPANDVIIELDFGAIEKY